MGTYADMTLSEENKHLSKHSYLIAPKYNLRTLLYNSHIFSLMRNKFCTDMNDYSYKNNIFAQMIFFHFRKLITDTTYRLNFSHSALK